MDWCNNSINCLNTIKLYKNRHWMFKSYNDPKDEYAIIKLHTMQAWRKEAKEIAKEALTYGMY